MRFGRFAATALWNIVALRTGPRTVVPLFDEIRELDGQVGPGTFYAAIARLERRGLIEPLAHVAGRHAYRLINQAVTA